MGRHHFCYNTKLERLTFKVVNLINKKPSLGKNLKDQLSQWISSAHIYPPDKIKFTPPQETKEKLKALGYISNGK